MEILKHLFSIFSILLLFGAFSIVYWSLKNGIGPMPTSSMVLKEIVKMPLKVKQGVIYELGSGWGSVAISLAKKYPENQVEAFETSLIPFLFSRLRLYFFPIANLHFHRQNFFDVKLENAALVYCYLYPAAMEKLKDKFELELPDDCLIVTNTFAFRHWQPVAVFPVDDLYHTHLYVYQLR